MDDRRRQDAQALFGEFAAAMHAWEVEAHALSQPENGGLEPHLERIRAGLTAIYARFLTAKERKTGRLAGPDVGFPPEYDPANERVVGSEEIGRKCVLETLWTHPALPHCTQRRRYTLAFAHERWWIDKKETFSAAKGKWVNETL